MSSRASLLVASSALWLSACGGGDGCGCDGPASPTAVDDPPTETVGPTEPAQVAPVGPCAPRVVRVAEIAEGRRVVGVLAGPAGALVTHGRSEEQGADDVYDCRMAAGLSALARTDGDPEAPRVLVAPESCTSGFPRPHALARGADGPVAVACSSGPEAPLACTVHAPWTPALDAMTFRTSDSVRGAGWNLAFVVSSGAIVGVATHGTDLVGLVARRDEPLVTGTVRAGVGEAFRLELALRLDPAPDGAVLVWGDRGQATAERIRIGLDGAARGAPEPVGPSALEPTDGPRIVSANNSIDGELRPSIRRFLHGALDPPTEPVTPETYVDRHDRQIARLPADAPNLDGIGGVDMAAVTHTPLVDRLGAQWMLGYIEGEGAAARLLVAPIEDDAERLEQDPTPLSEGEAGRAFSSAGVDRLWFAWDERIQGGPWRVRVAEVACEPRPPAEPP